MSCACFVPVEAPGGHKWWRPDLDTDPGGRVRVVARWGEDPELRRAVRVGGGWIEVGAMVNFYVDLTAPMPWERTGRCFADTPHAVVAVRQQPDGQWIVVDD